MLRLVKVSSDILSAASAPFFVRTEIVSAVAMPAANAGDLDGDGLVGIIDLIRLLQGWGTCPTYTPVCVGDLNCDGEVGIQDLLKLLTEWTG